MVRIASILVVASFCFSCGAKPSAPVSTEPLIESTDAPAKKPKVFKRELQLETEIPASPWHTALDYGACNSANWLRLSRCQNDAACVSRTLGEQCATCVREVIACGASEKCSSERMACIGKELGEHEENAKVLELLLHGIPAKPGIRVSPAIENVLGVTRNGRSAIGFSDRSLVVVGVDGEVEIDLSTITEMLAPGEKCARIFEAGGVLITLDCASGGWTLDSGSGLVRFPTPRASVHVDAKARPDYIVKHREGLFEYKLNTTAWPKFSPYDLQFAVVPGKIYKRGEVVHELKGDLHNGGGTTPWVGPFHVLTIANKPELRSEGDLYVTSILTGESEKIATGVSSPTVLPGVGIFSGTYNEIEQLFPKKQAKTKRPAHILFIGSRGELIGTRNGAQFLDLPQNERLIHETPIIGLHPKLDNRFWLVSKYAVSEFDAKTGKQKAVWRGADHGSSIARHRIIKDELILLTRDIELTKYELFAGSSTLEKRATLQSTPHTVPEFDATTLTEAERKGSGALGVSVLGNSNPNPPGCHDKGEWWACFEVEGKTKKFVLKRKSKSKVEASVSLPVWMKPRRSVLSKSGKFAIVSNFNGQRVLLDLSKEKVVEESKRINTGQAAFFVQDDGEVLRIEHGLFSKGLGTESEQD